MTRRYLGSDADGGPFSLYGEARGADMVTIEIRDERTGNTYAVTVDNCRLAIALGQDDQHP